MWSVLHGLSLQRGVKYIAIVDVIIFFVTLAAIAVERNACYSNPNILREYAFKETTFVSLASPHLTFSKVNYTDDSVTRFRRNFASYHVSKYEANLLNYFALILFLIALYIVLELWLTCVLIRAAIESQASLCKKWFWWRLSLLLLSFSGIVILFKLQMICTIFTCLPLEIYRLFSLIFIFIYQKQISENYGLSEKL